MERVAVSSAGPASNAGILKAHYGRRPPAYTLVMQTIHWGTVALLLCTYVAAWAIDNASNPADRACLLMLHRSFGITMLLVTGCRLVIRQRSRIPPLPVGLPWFQRVAARLSAVSLYVSLIQQPLLGLVASVLHGDRIVVFGGFVLPPLLPQNRALSHVLFQVHGAAATVLLALIGLHAAAALHHHFIRKDHVLVSMLPMIASGSGGAP